MKNNTFSTLISLFSFLFITGCSPDFTNSDKNIPNVSLTAYYNPVTLTSTSVELMGNASPDGLADLKVGFNVSTSETKINDPDDISTTVALYYPQSTSYFNYDLTSLKPHTKYYARAIAFINGGKNFDQMKFFYGDIISFTTEEYAVKTNVPETSIASTSVTVNGTVDNTATVKEAGILWSATSYPDMDDPKIVCDYNPNGSFSGNITGLKPNTQYYVRTYVINDNGVSRGDVIYFTTN